MSSETSHTHHILKSINRDLQLGESSSINSSSVISIHTDTWEIARLKSHTKHLFAKNHYCDFHRQIERRQQSTHTHTLTQLHYTWSKRRVNKHINQNSLLNWRIDFNSVFPWISQIFIIVVIRNTYMNIHTSHISCCVHRQDKTKKSTVSVTVCFDWLWNFQKTHIVHIIQSLYKYIVHDRDDIWNFFFVFCFSFRSYLMVTLTIGEPIRFGEPLQFLALDTLV